METTTTLEVISGRHVARIRYSEKTEFDVLFESLGIDTCEVVVEIIVTGPVVATRIDTFVNEKLIDRRYEYEVAS